jgi:hypothetical protein
LTNLLLDLVTAEGGRIVNVVSESYPATLELDNLQGEKRYGFLSAYFRSKLAQLRRLAGCGGAKPLIYHRRPPTGLHYIGDWALAAAAVILGGGWAGSSSRSLSSNRCSSGSGWV